MTRANVQYVCGVDPITRKDVYVPKRERERKIQKALVRWKAPESYRFVVEGLESAGRDDLLARFKGHPAVRRAQADARRSRKQKAARPASMDLDTCG